tara:strand:+ start:228 stop:587 length:360 start_codon:yes stop_codon:yes gene_type:complete
MTKILHSFTLYERASKLIRIKSRKGEMSDNVSNAIIWYYKQPKYIFEYIYDEELKMDVRSGKLIPNFTLEENVNNEYFAPFEKRMYERAMSKNLEIIDELRAENKALKDNRFKFWKKLP